MENLDTQTKDKKIQGKKIKLDYIVLNTLYCLVMSFIAVYASDFLEKFNVSYPISFISLGLIFSIFLRIFLVKNLCEFEERDLKSSFRIGFVNLYILVVFIFVYCSCDRITVELGASNKEINDVLELLTLLIGTIFLIVAGKRFRFEDHESPDYPFKFLLLRESWVPVVALLLAIFLDQSFMGFIPSGVDCSQVQGVSWCLVEDVFWDKIDIIALILMFAVLTRGLENSNYFHFAAYYIVEKCKGNTNRLILYLFILTSVLTFFTSNDIVILILTPIIVQVAIKAKIENPKLILLSQFVAANTLSMGLLIGSPTNLILSEELGINFFEYFFLMLPATIVSFGVAFLVVRNINRFFSREKKEYGNKNVIWAYCEEYEISGVPEKYANFNDEMRNRISLFALSVLIVAVCSMLNWNLLISVFGIFIAWIFYNFNNAQKNQKVIERLKYAINNKKEVGVKLIEELNCLPFSILMFGLVFFVFASAISMSDFQENNITFLSLKVFDGISDDLSLVGFYNILIGGIAVNIFNDLPASALISEILSFYSFENDGFHESLVLQGLLIGLNIGCYLSPVGALAGLIWFSQMNKTLNEEKKNNSKISMRLPRFMDMMVYGFIVFTISLLVLGITLPFFALVHDYFISSIRFDAPHYFNDLLVNDSFLYRSIEKILLLLNNIKPFWSKESFRSLPTIFYVGFILFFLIFLLFYFLKILKKYDIQAIHIKDSLVIITKVQILISKYIFLFGCVLFVLILVLSGWAVRSLEDDHLNIYAKNFSRASFPTEETFSSELVNRVAGCQSKNYLNKERSSIESRDFEKLIDVSQAIKNTQLLNNETLLKNYHMHFYCDVNDNRGINKSSNQIVSLDMELILKGTEDNRHPCCKVTREEDLLALREFKIRLNESSDSKSNIDVNYHLPTPLIEGLKLFSSWFFVFVGSGYNMKYFPASLGGALIMGILPFILMFLVIQIVQWLSQDDHTELSLKLAKGELLGTRRIIIFNYHPVFDAFVKRLIEADNIFLVIITREDFIEKARNILVEKHAEHWSYKSHVTKPIGNPEFMSDYFKIQEAQEIYFLSDRNKGTELNNLHYLSVLEKYASSPTEDSFSNEGKDKEEVDRSKLVKFPKIVFEIESENSRELIKRSLNEKLFKSINIVNFNEDLAEYLIADSQQSIFYINKFFFGCENENIFKSRSRKKFSEYVFREDEIFDEQKAKKIKEHFKWEKKKEYYIRQKSREKLENFTDENLEAYLGNDELSVNQIYGFSMEVSNNAHVRISLPATSICRQIETVEKIVTLVTNHVSNDRTPDDQIPFEFNNRILIVNLNPLSEAFLTKLIDRSENKSALNVVLYIHKNKTVPVKITNSQHVIIQRFDRYAAEDILDVLLPKSFSEYWRYSVNKKGRKHQPGEDIYIHPGDYVYLFLNVNQSIDHDIYQDDIQSEYLSIDLIDELQGRMEILEEEKKREEEQYNNSIQNEESLCKLPSHDNLYTLVEAQGRSSKFLFEHLYIDKILDNSWVRRCYFPALIRAYYHIDEPDYSLASFNNAQSIAKFLSHFIVRKVGDMEILKLDGQIKRLEHCTLDEAKTLIRNYAEPNMQLLTVLRINSKGKSAKLMSPSFDSKSGKDNENYVLEKDDLLINLPIL